jgi:hypothetical protein
VSVSAQPSTGLYARLGASVNIMQVDPLTSFEATAASGVDPQTNWDGMDAVSLKWGSAAPFAQRSRSTTAAAAGANLQLLAPPFPGQSGEFSSWGASKDQYVA